MRKKIGKNRVFVNTFAKFPKISENIHIYIYIVYIYMYILQNSQVSNPENIYFSYNKYNCIGKSLISGLSETAPPKP